MTSAQFTAAAAIAAALIVAAALGFLHHRRSGTIRDTAEGEIDTTGLNLSSDAPTIVHFTAAWCGPCSAVRRVVEQVCIDLPAVAHVEIDLDANPDAARKLSVLSLPTTVIFDATGRQRYRASGVPKRADLRSAVEPLLA